MLFTLFNDEAIIYNLVNSFIIISLALCERHFQMNGGKATKAPDELPYFPLDTRRGRANSCLFIFFCFVRKVIRWICVGYVATWKRHENFINCFQIHNSNPWFLVGSICKRICLNKQVNFTYSTRTFEARHECQGRVSDKWLDFETDECQLKRHLLTLVGAVCAWSNKVKFAGGNYSIFFHCHSFHPQVST